MKKFFSYGAAFRERLKKMGADARNEERRRDFAAKTWDVLSKAALVSGAADILANIGGAVSSASKNSFKSTVKSLHSKYVPHPSTSEMLMELSKNVKAGNDRNLEMTALLKTMDLKLDQILMKSGGAGACGVGSGEGFPLKGPRMGTDLMAAPAVRATVPPAERERVEAALGAAGKAPVMAEMAAEELMTPATSEAPEAEPAATAMEEALAAETEEALEAEPAATEEALAAETKEALAAEMEEALSVETEEVLEAAVMALMEVAPAAMAADPTAMLWLGGRNWKFSRADEA